MRLSSAIQFEVRLLLLHVLSEESMQLNYIRLSAYKEDNSIFTLNTKETISKYKLE